MEDPTQIKTRPRGKVSAIVMAFAAGASYGLAGAVSRLVGTGGFTVSQIVVAQTLMAVLILGILVLVKYKPSNLRIIDAIKLMGVGVCSIASGYCYYTAIDMLSVGTAVAIQFQYVWIVVVIAAVANRTRPNKWVIMATVLIIFGTFFGSGMADEIITNGSLLMNPTGLLIAFACAVFYGLFIFLNGKVALEQPAVARSFFMMLGGLILASALCPGFYLGECDIIALAPGGLVMGLVSSIIPCVCLAAASTKLPGGLVAILTSSELPTAVLAGALMFGEAITPLVLFGVILILASIVLSEAESFSSSSKIPVST